jgi:hypothetical protein
LAIESSAGYESPKHRFTLLRIVSLMVSVLTAFVMAGGKPEYPAAEAKKYITGARLHRDYQHRFPISHYPDDEKKLKRAKAEASRRQR